MASNVISKKPSTSGCFSSASLPTPSSFQNSFTGLDSEMTVVAASERESLISSCSIEANAAVNTSKDGWTRSLTDLPPFEYAFIEQYLVENSAKMPDNRPAGAHRHKKLGYRLFKERYLKSETKCASLFKAFRCKKSCLRLNEVAIPRCTYSPFPSRWQDCEGKMLLSSWCWGLLQACCSYFVSNT